MVIQATRTDVVYPDGLEEVTLTEVVRCSERILTAASMFQLGETKNKTTSHHVVTGPPLQTFLFDRASIPHTGERGRQASFFEAYVKKIEPHPEHMDPAPSPPYDPNMAGTPRKHSRRSSSSCPSLAICRCTIAWPSSCPTTATWRLRARREPGPNLM